MEVERLTGWDLLLVGPSNWVDDYGTVRGLAPADHFQGRVIAVPVWPPASIPLHLYRSTFVSLLRTERPDVVYVHNEPYAASTAQLLAANHLSGVRAAFGFYSAQNIEKSYPPPFRWTERWVYNHSSFAFPCSQTVLDTLRAKGYFHPATHLPLGIDPDLYRPHREDVALRRRLAGDADVLFGYVGRVTAEKGLTTLFHALTALPLTLRWRLVVVGTGVQELELRALADECGLTDRIEWVGYVDHTAVPRYLSVLDALVVPSETQPSWKEQFGRVIVEALACETPVVGTNSGEIPHLLRQTGGGIVVEERNATALAEGLLSMAECTDRRQTYASQGANYVRSHFAHSTLAASFASSIESARSLKAFAA